MFDRKKLKPAASCNTCGNDACTPELAFNDADWFVCDRWQLAEDTFGQVCHDTGIDCHPASCTSCPICETSEKEQ